MLNIHNLTVSFQGDDLFSGITFQLRSGDRVGLVGKNGAGKSTLLKILSGEQEYDKGQIASDKEISIGFVISILATACGVFLYLQYFSKYGFEETILMIQKGNLYAQVLSLAALPNLFVFFIFIKKKQDYRARGVLMASILTALVTFVLKFL